MYDFFVTSLKKQDYLKCWCRQQEDGDAMFMLVVIDYVDDGDDLLTLCDFSLYINVYYCILKY